MTTAAQAALSVLKANGITRIFGNPGTTEMPLLDGIVEQGIQFHLALHEGLATAMADGFGRACGTPGVVLVHTSVGTANSLMNVINACSDRAPLVVIAGDKDDRLTGRRCFVEVPDIGGIMRQVSKVAWRATMPEHLPEMMRRALGIAQSPPAGPVYLAVPENYMGDKITDRCSAGEAARTTRMSARVHPDDLRLIIEKLVKASRPLLIAGNEVGWCDSASQLGDLAVRFAAPIVGEEPFTTNSLNVPSDHPHNHGNFAANLEVVRNADVIVSFGANLFKEYAYPEIPALPPEAELIQIGTDPAEFDKIYPATTTLFGNVGEAISDILQLADKAQDASAEWQLRLQRATRRDSKTRRFALTPLPAPLPGHIHLGDLVDAIDASLPADGIVVDESVLSKFLLLERLPLNGQRRYFGTSGGGLGWGLGAAMGVQLALPGRRVAAFLGDGGAMFSIQGLWTAAHLRLPVVFVIVNNGGYMAVRRGLGEFAGVAAARENFPGAFLDSPAIDFCQIAAGLGVDALSVSDPALLTDTLREAFARERPVLVDVKVNSSEYYELKTNNDLVSSQN